MIYLSTDVSGGCTPEPYPPDLLDCLKQLSRNADPSIEQGEPVSTFCTRNFIQWKTAEEYRPTMNLDYQAAFQVVTPKTRAKNLTDGQIKSMKSSMSLKQSNMDNQLKHAKLSRTAKQSVNQRSHATNYFPFDIRAVRKEYRVLTFEERERYHYAVNELRYRDFGGVSEICIYFFNDC